MNRQNETIKQNILTKDFNKSHTYGFDKNINDVKDRSIKDEEQYYKCICALPVFESGSLHRALRNEIVNGEFIFCIKLSEECEMYNMLMFLFHTLESYINKSEELCNLRNNILRNLKDLYILIRVNDGIPMICSMRCQSYEILSFCCANMMIDTIKIMLLKSFVISEVDDYDKMIIDEILKEFNRKSENYIFTEDDLYIREDDMYKKDIKHLIEFLPCWRKYYHDYNCDEITRMLDDKDINAKDSIKIGKLNYLSAYGYLSDRKCDQTRIIRWCNDYDHRHQYFNGLPYGVEILPRVIIDIVVDYDNSIDSAMSRLCNQLLTNYGYKLSYSGFVWRTEVRSNNINDKNKIMKCIKDDINTHENKINDFNINNIYRILYDLIYNFWPAPSWKKSDKLKKKIEYFRQDDIILARLYSSGILPLINSDTRDISYSNGEFIMAALLLGYSIDEPRFASSNVNIRMNLFPYFDTIGIIKEVFSKN